ncbi:hypothetical protein Afil01_23300 [Actinorhabdospora filicis]|uniref:Uncharacterized protein n=1 Tax=Actinorhabdospora filicis TaxID=1785913 RepID=A0A9W6SJR4_9ACTN|nr:hypothetical protein [Actinorhabdospora filicis]GLZ77523.1 hypothetical protein Afil01_23300 [Actinorhabdospora filicis]
MSNPGEIAAVIRAVLEALPVDALRAANTAAGESAERIAAATEGTGHDAPREALAHIAEGIERTGEALAGLGEIRERLNAYLAVLVPGVEAMVARPIAGPAGKRPITPPNRRHHLNSVGRKSQVREENTVILPGTDVRGDLDAIRRGEAAWLPDRDRCLVNGRLYGVEVPGTVYPDEGPGLVKLNRSEYKALKGLIEARGDMDSLPSALANNPAVTGADWQRAAEVYEHHKDYRSEDT